MANGGEEEDIAILIHFLGWIEYTLPKALFGHTSVCQTAHASCVQAF